MPEGLSPQERIDLGPGPYLNEDDEAIIIGGTFKEGREDFLREPYFEAAIVRSIVDHEDLDTLIAEGEILAFKDHGDYLFPAFQFDTETLQPLQVVKNINRILDAPNDGWGVAGWWMQGNTRLPLSETGEHTAPKDWVSDTIYHEMLVALADSIVNDDSY